MLADIPGLIEGASGGAGLGHEFLAHVERCRLLVHVLDLAPLDGSDPVANHATVEAELREHGHGLADLPRVLCLSKADLVPPDDVEAAVRDWQRRLEIPVLATSAATGAGVPELRDAIFERVPEEAARGAGERAAGRRIASTAPGPATRSASSASRRARSGWRAGASTG